MSVNSGIKTAKIIGQRKAFYRQRIPESSCARKKTVDIDILVTSRNGDRKIMQTIKIMSRPPSRKRFNIFSGIIYHLTTFCLCTKSFLVS